MGAPSRTVLVADDDPGHLRLLELVLGAYKFEVISVENGHDALTYLQSHTPDMMILDVNMPFMSGLDVCSRARRLSRLKSVPVIIMTALTDEATRLRADEAGADLFLSKPLTGTDLRGAIGSLLTTPG
jgi:DNA-binding response OmpR family regulator